MGPDLHGAQPQQAAREPEWASCLTVARIPRRLRRVCAGSGCDSAPFLRVPARLRFQGAVPNPASWTLPTGLRRKGTPANPLLRQAPRPATNAGVLSLPSPTPVGCSSAPVREIGPMHTCPARRMPAPGSTGSGLGREELRQGRRRRSSSRQSGSGSPDGDWFQPCLKPSPEPLTHQLRLPAFRPFSKTALFRELQLESIAGIGYRSAIPAGRRKPVGW